MKGKGDEDHPYNPERSVCSVQWNNRNSGGRMMDEEPAGVNEHRSMLSQPRYILNATSIIASSAWCQKALLTVCFIEITINCITYAFLPPDVLLGHLEHKLHPVLYSAGERAGKSLEV